MDEMDYRLMEVLEIGLPLVEKPFAAVGQRLGIPETEVIDRVQNLRESGIVRRIRARIDQRKLGIVANALVAWKPPAGGRTGFAERLAAFSSVTHCYERCPLVGRWEYTLYTVHHGYSREQVTAEVDSIAEATGCQDYCIIFSTCEYKRVPSVRMRENGGVKV
ncbi:MAG: Lrp/AsnC family transcriptional regulator [Methanomicrobiales archaeon]|nr:Lrp/AsnC family transcriptional regulator [Methanomicrobiales archaeon]